MKRLFCSVIIAAFALLTVSCEKETVPDTGDKTGDLYGVWVLDTKNVENVTDNNGKTDVSHEETDFKGEHFLLKLTDFNMAFAQEGSIFTFDIDDVDSTPYTYNSDLKQISFEKPLILSTGFLPAKVMKLHGTYDVVKLTEKSLVIKMVDEVKIGTLSNTQTTVYTYHKQTTESK
jgi:hypothetical protein